MKKRGFGEGRWNGLGGKVQEDEDLLGAVAREAREELGIVPREPSRHATIRFFFEDGTLDWRVHVFRAEDFEGDPQESEEMTPRWFPLGEIPYEEMWPADRHWLPLLVDGKRFEAEITFKNKDEVSRYEIREV